MSNIYLRVFRGIQGDAYYYYSYAVSILWDGDLDLTNQFNHPLPGSKEQTITGGNYFIDARTGRAFSLFNIGTGLLMLPALSLRRSLDLVKGEDKLDPFSLHYQYFACYTNVIFTSLALLVLFIILGQRFSLSVALLGPPLFLFGTNWLFYATVFSGWAHSYFTATCIFVLWSYLNLVKKKSYFYAILFGLFSGILFGIRNISLTLFLALFLFLFSNLKRNQGSLAYLERLKPKNSFQEDESKPCRISRSKPIFLSGLKAYIKEALILLQLNGKEAALLLVSLLSFLLAALPQFYYFHLTHGSPFISSFQAASSALKPFFSPEAEHFQVIYWKNLHLLSATLFNSENGLFYFHPLYLFGLLGFIFYRHRQWRFQATILSLFFSTYIYWYFDAAYWDTWFCRAAGAGFGHRRFVDILPFFIFGAAFILEKARRNKISCFIIAGLCSFLLIASLSLFKIFIGDYAAFYREKDYFFAFYAFLYRGWKIKVLFLIIWFCLFFFFQLLKDRISTGLNEPAEIIKGEAEVSLQRPILVGVIILILVWPLFIFKYNSEWERQRFKERQGFFLLYSPTPLVKLYGKEWSLSDGNGRRMIGSVATMELSSPLKKGDLILFKISTSSEGKKGGDKLEIYLDHIYLGSQAIKSGKHVYLFPVKKEGNGKRKLEVRLVRMTEREALIFHEGKIIFGDEDKPPFGHVDLPVEATVVASEKVELAGWALDDRGLSAVEIWGMGKVKADEHLRAQTKEVQEKFLVKAEFEEGTRPDVEKVFVLYPDILRSGWRAEISRDIIPMEWQKQPLLIRIIARDNRGNQTELGQKIIYWQ